MHLSARLNSTLRPTVWAILWGWWLMAVGLPSAHAYVLEGWHWPSDEPIVLALQLGSPDHALSDGSTSWNGVAEAAIAIWNPYLGDGVQLEASSDMRTPQQGDGKNEVFFDTSAYGEGFGDDALAVTLTLYDTNTGVASESDVIFNSAEPFDSYRGDLRTGSDGNAVYDLRRVAIHEFGHVLGLGHPPRGTIAIMDPVISDIDTVQTDDLAGLATIYGTPGNEPEIFEGLSAAAVVGKPFSFQIRAFGTGISYQADPVPAGLGLDASAGLISGTPTLPGTYVVNITATNGVGSASTTLTLTIVAPPTITGLLNVTATINQPFTYQVRTSSAVASYGVYNLPPGLSYNASTGVISGTPTLTGTYSVALDVSNAAGEDSKDLVIQVIYDSAVKVIASVNAGQGANSVSALLQAADGNLYGAGTIGKSSGGCVFQITLDGALTILHGFDSNDGSSPAGPLVQDGNGNFYGQTSRLYNGVGTIFKMTPDGTVTTLHAFAPSFSADVTVPALVVGLDGNLYGGQSEFATTPASTDYGVIFQITPDGTFTVFHELTADERGVSALIIGADGNFYGTFESGEANPYGAVFRMTPDGMVTVLHAFTAAEGSLPNGVIQGSDGNFYGTTQDFESSESTNIAFKVAPDGTLSTLHVFSGEEGNWPTGLTAGSDGNFYGTARSGGGENCILFRLTPDGTFTKLHTFGTDEGYAPTPVIQVADGNFYGLIGGGTQAEIFRTVAGSALTVTAAATSSKVTAGNGEVGSYIVSLSTAPTSDLIVGYALKGSAVNGIDYQMLKGTIKIKAGQTSKNIPIVPLVHAAMATSTKIKLTLLAGSGYTVGTTTPANVKIISGKP